MSFFTSLLFAVLCLLTSAVLSAAFTQTDTVPPQVMINSPRAGYLYLMDREMMPIRERAIVIGMITADVTAKDSDSGVDRVEFWIGFGCHGEKHFTDDQEPYVWTWTDHQSAGLRKIRAYAFDKAGNEDFAEIEVIKIF